MPASPPLQCPDAALPWTAVTSSGSPSGGGVGRSRDDIPTGLLELGPGPRGVRTPARARGSRATGPMRKRPPGGANSLRVPHGPGHPPPQPRRHLSGCHSNRASGPSAARGWPGGSGAPSTELPGCPGLTSASREGLGHFSGGAPRTGPPAGLWPAVGALSGPPCHPGSVSLPQEDLRILWGSLSGDSAPHGRDFGWTQDTFQGGP